MLHQRTLVTAYWVHGKPGKLIYSQKISYTFCVIAIKHTGWRGSINEWIPSKSNLVFSKHFYFSILGTKEIAIDCQNR
jgi:hypothetical protein